jgi:Mediator complex subunit 13 C-terminal domain
MSSVFCILCLYSSDDHGRMISSKSYLPLFTFWQIRVTTEMWAEKHSYFLVQSTQRNKSHHLGVDQVACRICDRLLRCVKRLIFLYYLLLECLKSTSTPRRSLWSVQSRRLKDSIYRHSSTVLERYTVLHFSYQISKCGRWLVVTSVDQLC